MLLLRRGAYLALISSLILCLALSLSSCEKEDEIVKEGLSLSDSSNEEHEDRMRESAYAAILPILSDYYRESGRSITEEALRDEALLVAEMTLSDRIGYTDHSLFMNALCDNRDELAPLLSGESLTDMTLIGEAYISLTENVSADFVGEFLYKLTLYAFDKRINKHLAVGDAVNNVLANSLAAEKAIVEEEIGERNFREVVKLFLVSRAIFVTDGNPSDIYDKFTDAEVLLIIQRLEISHINVTPRGYLLLAEYYSDSMILWESSYLHSELFYEATYNGDLYAFLQNADSLIELIAAIKNSLTKEDIALIRTGDAEKLFSNIFEHFGEKEWTLLEKITPTTQKSKRYYDIAKRFLGEEFVLYAESGEPVSLEELRRGVGGEDFYNLLEGYVFGISPAFSYGMKK